jgi:chromosome segregation ATPase
MAETLPPMSQSATLQAGTTHMDTFLENGLAAAHSDADKIFVYQDAFDVLASNFDVCRPLLQRIRYQYDLMGKYLLTKKREAALNQVDDARADDSFTEIISQVRRVRSREFASLREQSERMLDELTALRVQRMDLLAQLETLKARKDALTVVEDTYEDRMFELNTAMRELTDDRKNIQTCCKDAKEQILFLRDETKKTEVSLNDLREKSEAMAADIIRLKQREKESREKLFDMDPNTGAILPIVKTLERELAVVQAEEKEAHERRDVTTARREKVAADLKKYLQGKDPDDVIGLVSFECV